MKTKIIYVLTSTIKDIYMEQLWVSITSLRMHNPKVHIAILMDSITYDSLIGERAKILELIEEPIIVPTPLGYSQKEMSRYIKTSARRWVKGDFLYLDTDTIITEDLKDIDYIEGDILACPEFHVAFKNNPMHASLTKKVWDIFNVDICNSPNYYNSGVILCKDTKLSYEFYELWNKNWMYSKNEKNVLFDQPSFAKTDYDLRYAIKELDGIYHCQIFFSMKYLHRAKIIHFFNMSWFKGQEISPFTDNELYRNIKKNKCIDNKTLHLIKDVKNQFDPISVIVSKNEFNLLVEYGQALKTIMIEPDTKLKVLCKYIIKTTIKFYYFCDNLYSKIFK